MAEFTETRKQTGIQMKHSAGQKGIKKNTKTFLGQMCYKFRTRNIQDSTQSAKILKQISKDVKETARIQGNINENVFLKYHVKLWNRTNINELQLE